MKTFRLANFADENGCLDNAEDAAFLARKIGKEDTIDFSGIASVTEPFLDILLKDQPLATLVGRIIGQSGKTAGSLNEWFNKNQQSVEKNTSSLHSSKPSSAITPTPSFLFEFNKPSIEGERYTPTRLVTRLRRQLTSYIESAYPLNDPTLIRSRRKLLEEASNGRLLAQEPYVETTPRYKTFSGGYKDLGLPKHIAEMFHNLANTPQQYNKPEDEKKKTILYPGMWLHQSEAFKQFLNEGKDIIVATGTGSGKTECFLVPLLGMLYNEAYTKPDSFRIRGVRSLILYPMNALVNDQLSRLRLLFGDTSLVDEFRKTPSNNCFPTFGMYTGRTLYPGPRDKTKDRERVRPLMEYYESMDEGLKQELKMLGRYPAKNLTEFYSKHLEEKRFYKSGKKQGDTYTDYNWEKRLHTQPEDHELLIRQEMVFGSGSLPGNAPDILITNYSMLEYMLMRPFERPLFKQTKEWLEQEGNQFLIVLDEAHMYRGAKGAEVGFLLRRLRARLGITDRPDKLRVIFTSASLGSDASALNNIRRFAADLTGKTPDDFVAITGKREVPQNAEPGSEILANILADIDLDNLHVSAGAEMLAKALSPLFEHLKSPCQSDSEDGILKHLYLTLREQTFVNQLLKETAGTAISLSSLAEAVFPNHPRRRKAIEVLLTLGAIAREFREEPGLIPTRVHAMFRGLNALYACINPKCLGRQDQPGIKAPVGKLFTGTRTACDVCGSRVFELASCRRCGVTYLLAYHISDDIQTLEFMLGEMEGELKQIQFLTTAPRYPELTEEISVQLKTGFIDRKLQFEKSEARSLWISVDSKGYKQAIFNKCSLCQSPSSRKTSQITDFRTKGEQPFTALLEAQFGEQPPQKADVNLPNRGRKVLVFSDGRQKAARLAPALETSHARNLFRQVLALAAHELEQRIEHPGMGKLYPAVLWVCHNRGLNLFPSADETEFREHLARSKDKSFSELLYLYNQAMLRPTLSYAKQLFTEITDPYYSLTALAIATVVEDTIFSNIFAAFPDVGLSKAEISTFMRNWFRKQLESNRFLPPGADVSQLRDGWDKPEGIDAARPTDVLPSSIKDYVTCILENEKLVEPITNWLTHFVRFSGLFKLENNLYFLQPDGLALRLRLNGPWYRCSSCSRIHAEALKLCCPDCLGKLIPAEEAFLDARAGYYREQVLKAFDGTSLEPFSLTTAEHSAQLTGHDYDDAYNKTEKYELRFQDIPVDGEPPIDILSCTTTMEVGIDIGTLSGVALRNVPPHVANYQQRAGRAGRRGRSVASVITYAHGNSHDAHFYEHPENIISGNVRAPIVYIENQQVLSRHINAYLVQRFFHDAIGANPEVFQLFESLGTVEQFLSNQYPCSLQKLVEWLRTCENLLKQEISQWVPNFSYGLNEKISIASTINGAIDCLINSLNTFLPVEAFNNRENLEGVEREVIERQLEEKLLNTLIYRAIFPRYAFPTDVVSFWVAKRKRKGDPPHKRSFEYQPQRDLQIALSEFAPSSLLTIDKFRFNSSAIFSPYVSINSVIHNAQSYTSCPLCGYVSLKETDEKLIACPCCNNEELFSKKFITPPGFSPDINVMPEVDQGGTVVVAGRTSRAQLEVQDTPSKWDDIKYSGRLSLIARSQNLVTINKGIGDRGFMVCVDCGRAEPVFGTGFTNTVMIKNGKVIRHYNPLEEGVFCDGHPVGPYYLGHHFPTDVLLIKLQLSSPMICNTVGASFGRPGRVAITSLVEAICLAASQTLQIDEGELSGNWSPVLGGGNSEIYLFLYDLLPGGAGYTKIVKECIDEVLLATEKLLSSCDCESSCYRCLRHYGNHFLHGALDRHLALALIRYIQYETIPSLSTKEKEKALEPLLELLRLRGNSFQLNRDPKENTVITSLVISSKRNKDILLTLHHPLVEPSSTSSTINSEKNKELYYIDTFTLQHDLPAVIAILAID